MAKAKKTHTVVSYNSYYFRANEQDPVVDQLRAIASGVKNSKLSLDSGVSAGTLNNWWKGKTRRPQYATACATARALGYDFILAPMKMAAAEGKKMMADAPQIMKRFPTRAEIAVSLPQH